MDSTNAVQTRGKSGSGRRSASLVIFLCWLIVVLDGYDLIVYGTTLPTLSKELGLAPTQAGFLGSMVFIGALFGALGAGDIADRLGRRRTVLIAGLVFTVFTMAVAWAPNKEVFGVLRFIAGFGLGGLVPSANAITSEFVRVKNRSLVSTIMMSGIPIGGSLAALLGIVMLPDNPGWRAMYLVSAVGLIVLAVAYFVLPESPSWLLSKGREAEAREVAARWGVDHTLDDVKKAHDENPMEASAEAESPHSKGLAALFASRWRLATILFAFTSIFTLFTCYGLGTWLPKLMASNAHYSELMFNPLVFLLRLNLGAVAGSFIMAWFGVRIGPIQAGIGGAALAAAGLAFLLTYPSNPYLANLALVFAGIGTHGTQSLVLAAIASHYPAALRGKGLGFASGMGRIGAITAPILGGVLVAAAATSSNPNTGTSWNFLMFATSAALASLSLFITWRATKPTSEKSGDPVMAH